MSLSPAIDHDTTSELAQRWDALKAEQPKLRIRDAALKLGVSEVELLATQVGKSATRLRPEFKAIFEALPSLGRVMALTRNDWAVIEKHGAYDNVDIGDHVGLVLDPEIDLRLFMGRYHSVYAIDQEDQRGRPLRGLQMFGPDGDAIHKIYLRTEEGVAPWRALVERFAHDDQSQGQSVSAAQAPPAPASDEDIDVAGFQQAWLDMQDTHEFFALLRRFGVSRTQGLRLAPQGHAIPIDVSALDRALVLASQRELPIMVFVGNSGCIEIHTGPVQKIVEMGDWVNVMDPDFNLHVNRTGLTRAWIVRKPTADGVVTSLEVFSDTEHPVAMLFGARKPGIPEDERWRELVSALLDSEA